ncbi:cell wall-binding repeat-containing protein [Clostridium autoethanogenum]|jgi:putative cell wall-binding protein|uniref:Cell wall-binding repeat-containing protein n=1 Tax=Clostridium autoethanogenum DSM 10061 TaxID=1341692 RepID=A0ABM5NW61_9CLOT|nr:cell wall-binding repeat-containing protein [Clostridium autoethanogenum]AGY76766.1 cell wall-binding repeat-containing protein [Clostridium autoethanogenum DSM 10061]ALU36920.1 Cell wall binding repeat 2-containing protein [Clostridium autoethanogenum DSM 10061]OVY50390.1 N-acetylmuramoyl-L-alanine amidase LytC precursor [Clostridium autoethanogenum]
MSKKSTKALASATLMSLVLTTALSAGPVKAAQGPVNRVSGGDRYATAAKVATTNWTTSDNVVLVSGEGYADAVSASALAKKLNAPILLTTGNTLSSEAQSALNTLKPKNVYVIGGNASISQSIRDGLKANYTLKELGGQNRYETNVAVAKELVSLGVSASDVMVVGGQGFADALSVAPVAAAKGQILLLANNDQDASQAAINFVKDNNSKVTVVGTTNVISDAIKNAFGSNVTRVDGGSSRFDTNLKVLDAFKADLKADKLYVANASAADPDNLYADALVASALAGKYTAPLVLVDKDGTDATNKAVAYIKGENAKDIEVIGGTGVVPDSIINEITGTTPSTDPEVSSISNVGLNQIKVVFNQEVDSDTAEDVTNYKVDGSALTTQDVNSTTPSDTDATATLQSDNKTVLITLAKKEKQNSSVDVTVKKGILTADKSGNVPEFTQTIAFADTTAPTLSSVSARGNNKLDVVFSEPVKVKATSQKNALQQIASKLKINDKNLSSFGINYETNTDTSLEYSALDDSLKASTESGYYYTDEVEIYFDTALPTGNNTLKISDADDDTLSDAAGFPIADTTQDFTVDTLTSTPKITSITAEDSGKVYANFDRPMDAKTAVEMGNYKINGKSITTAPELKKGDTQVKISGVSGLLNKNSNTISISDKVEDAYGNKVAEDTNESFTLDEDTTKPTVTSVSALDDTTIRVKYSKDVDAKYATNVSNYKLKDSDGTDITSAIPSTNGITVPGETSPVTTDVVDIHLNTKLTDAKYTITIKNIEDTATTPNVMDDYTTTFDGSSDVNAEVTGVYAVNDSSNLGRKITLVFNKEMDSSSLNNVSNYQFKNEKGDTKTLPSGSDISISSDNKSVTIKLPTSYTYYYTVNNVVGTGVNTAITSEDNQVTALYAQGVKDVNGNTLQVGSYGGNVQAAGDGATVKPNSLKVYYDNDDLKADVSFTAPIDADTMDASKFTLGGQQADSASVDGSKVTLTFKSNNDDTNNDAIDLTSLTKVNTIKKLGANAALAITDDSTIKDVTGAAVTTGGTVTPYFYDAAPKTIVTKNANGNVTDWSAKLDSTAGSENVKVNVQFDTPIEASSVQPGDFTFSIGGTTIDADDVDTSQAANGIVTFVFDKVNNHTGYSKIVAAGGVGATLKITPKASSTITTPKDGNGDYTSYAPTDDDLKGITVTITALGN